jgi:hypothetical protein
MRTSLVIVMILSLFYFFGCSQKEETGQVTPPAKETMKVTPQEEEPAPAEQGTGMETNAAPETGEVQEGEAPMQEEGATQKAEEQAQPEATGTQPSPGAETNETTP